MGKRRVIRFEYSLTEGRVRQENVELSDIADFTMRAFSLGTRMADINAVGTSATLMISSMGKETFLCKNSGNGSGIKKDGDAAPQRESAPPLDREKKRLLSGGEEFLKVLGVSDDSGRVHDKKQAKFRQISRFCEHIRDAVKYLPKDGIINVCDMCCGKSYLSFAAYHCLTEIFGRDVSMTCIDIKKSVIDFCAEKAEKLGYRSMKFICGDVSNFNPGRDVHLVISLHACDTATDAVLDFAVRNRASVILSTPCCQHEMFHIMNSPPLDFAARYSVIKQKICSAATDALRLCRLEAEGYKTDAVEFTDPEDTPKNTLLRAVIRKGYDFTSKDAVKKAEYYRESYRFMTGLDAPRLYLGNFDKIIKS